MEWKHRQSSEYLEQIEFGDIEVALLALLKILPTLDFQALADALGEKVTETADALLRLALLHIIEHSGDEFSISPPLRMAVERDKRVSLPDAKRKQALAKLADFSP